MMHFHWPGEVRRSMTFHWTTEKNRRGSMNFHWTDEVRRLGFFRPQYLPVGVGADWARRFLVVRAHVGSFRRAVVLNTTARRKLPTQFSRCCRAVVFSRSPRAVVFRSSRRAVVFRSSRRLVVQVLVVHQVLACTRLKWCPEVLVVQIPEFSSCSGVQQWRSAGSAFQESPSIAGAGTFLPLQQSCRASCNKNC